MAFKIKDLLISVAPTDDANAQGNAPFYGAGCGCSGHSTLLLWNWFTCLIGAPGYSKGWIAGDPVVAAEQIAFLKSQLRQELAALEQREKEIESRLRPKSVQEIEKLEAQIQDALEELQKLKPRLNLKSKPRSGKKK
jgi:hypothetical protein